MSQSQPYDAILTTEESADLISESEVRKRLDLGHSMLYLLGHPQHGDLVVLNSGVGHSGMLNLSMK